VSKLANLSTSDNKVFELIYNLKSRSDGR
jgi:hypothetical protein